MAVFWLGQPTNPGTPVCRLKDIIIRGGANISVNEIEGHLVAHPRIQQAAVVGYPDTRLGEKVCAIVVATPGEPLALEQVTDYLRNERRISPHKLPERLIVVNEMPITPTGKIQKFRLRELASQPPASCPQHALATCNTPSITVWHVCDLAK
jgi:non-ribosomal peptide synthetase component E (peptide arylation enzyme)